jgi:hypothetical protein
MGCLGHGWQEAERAYQLWKARQVADQQGSGAVTVAPVMEETTHGNGKRRRVQAGPEELSGGATAEGSGEPRDVTRMTTRGMVNGRKKAALLEERAVQSLKPELFEECMELMGVSYFNIWDRNYYL